ncbi:MAG: protein-export chaperone SecB [Alphaproteobacteria bacterium RIFCSPLOWO2_01_FULL_45_8]|nr:MAG: protein-export chaperone SecB [Alphaproteobacteria bacterium GWA1_45_9]OFW90114.1 MAG: protein-export chaperone SecB [Alphaproteobacteria bacterium RIFCSPHIGHO2_01_FULL_41_14]OFW96711.1 MAG: protein-export chaperone SecB [Alphaproteobacteria bacterium RIFCSPLOWO2_01_FULL_45_8]
MKNKDQEVMPLLVNNANYIKDLSFENPGILREIPDPAAGPNLDINIHVDVTPVGEHVYEVALVLNIQAKQNDHNMFLIELSYAGIFRVAEAADHDDEQRKRLLLIEAPSLLFPFARSIVSNLTREGGLPPLLLNPVNFEIMYEQTVREMEKTKH